MKYLDGEELLVLHARVIESTRGTHGVRDVGLLGSILAGPRQKFGGQELYRGVWTKAAFYFERLSKFHVFVDGNKRSAIAASARFLWLNGHQLSASNAAVETFVLKVISERLDVDAIAKWLKQQAKKRRKH